MTRDDTLDNTTWVLTNSSFENNWDTLRSAKNSTGRNSTGEEDSPDKSTFAADIPRGSAGSSRATNVSSNETIESVIEIAAKALNGSTNQTIDNETTERARGLARNTSSGNATLATSAGSTGRTFSVKSKETIDGGAEAANASGNNLGSPEASSAVTKPLALRSTVTVPLSTAGEKDAAKGVTTETSGNETKTPVDAKNGSAIHVLNARGSAGNTTDIMDILSDPERKKWPAEQERVEEEPLRVRKMCSKYRVDAFHEWLCYFQGCLWG